VPSAAWLGLGQHVVLALTVVAVPVLDAQWLLACLKASLSDGPGLVDREELGQKLEGRLDRLRYTGQGIGPAPARSGSARSTRTCTIACSWRAPPGSRLA